MRADRLLSILMLLQVKRRLTAASLADEFGVSVRTIYRDVDALGTTGVPVYADRGPGGGFTLLEGYRSDLTGLASDEAEAMLMIGLPGPAAALGLGPAAARARAKLLAALPGQRVEGATKLASRFHLDPVDWYRDTEPAPHLQAVARAVLEQRVVTLRYVSWKRERCWTAEPLGLVLKAGAWYLVGRVEGRPQVFKVAAIREFSLADRSFRRPARFDLARWWADELQRFEARLRPATAVLRANAAGLQRLANHGAYAARAVAAADPADRRGWARVTLPIENTTQAAALVLGMGADVRVLAPGELRQRVRQLARRVLKAYGPAR